MQTVEGYHDNCGLNYHFGNGNIIQARAVFNCAGNYSDKVAKKLGLELDVLNCLLKGYYMRTKLSNMDSDFPLPLL